VRNSREANQGAGFGREEGNTEGGGKVRREWGGGGGCGVGG